MTVISAEEKFMERAARIYRDRDCGNPLAHLAGGDVIGEKWRTQSFKEAICGADRMLMDAVAYYEGKEGDMAIKTLWRWYKANLRKDWESRL